MKRVLQEALLVALTGAILAFFANGLSPRGLTLARDYHIGLGQAATNALPAPGGTNLVAPLDKLAAELKAQGLQLARSNQVLQFFHDPGYPQGLIAFVDARHPEEYEQGHVPGAHLFDSAQPDKYFNDVYPACQMALEVVVYCNGGECEESERAAIVLRDLGVPKEKLYVYAGGITEWRTNAWPMELGPRNSGRMLEAKK